MNLFSFNSQSENQAFLMYQKQIEEQQQNLLAFMKKKETQNPLIQNEKFSLIDNIQNKQNQQNQEGSQQNFEDGEENDVVVKKIKLENINNNTNDSKMQNQQGEHGYPNKQLNSNFQFYSDIKTENYVQELQNKQNSNINQGRKTECRNNKEYSISQQNRKNFIQHNVSPLGTQIQEFIGNELRNSNYVSNDTNSNLLMKNSMTCDMHKGQILDKVCLSSQCHKQRVICKTCINQHHHNHEIMSIEDYMDQIKQWESKVEKNSNQEKNSWDKIQIIAENNCAYLETLEQMAKQLAENCRKLQKTMKIIEERQALDDSNIIKKIQSVYVRHKNPISYESRIQISEITSLVEIQQKYQYPALKTSPSIIESIEFYDQINQYHEQCLKDFAFNINKSNENQKQLESQYNYKEFSLITKMKQEQNQQDLNSKMSKMFHFVKGKAKKRDMINFVNWDEEKKELKFMKDIKEREENSHYQLVFSIHLKNLECFEENQINEELLQWLTQIVIQKYPEVKKQKEEQRKSINIKDGNNKRKYCKFNPRFDVDLQQFFQSKISVNE